MTNLSDFLKCRKVKCVENRGRSLTVGKIYTILSVVVPLRKIKVENDTGANVEYDILCFEPVLDSAKNPLQDVELTSEFEAVEPILVDDRQFNIQDIGTDILDTNADIKDTPKFKVGDPVYWGLKSRIFKVFRLMTANVLEVELDYVVTAVHKDELCPATLENYGKLCSLFERIDFEAPPKPLTGSDLARAMLDKGWKYVPCFVSDVSEEIAVIKDASYFVARHDGVEFFEPEGTNWRFAVPFDPRTGEPLTESILND